MLRVTLGFLIVVQCTFASPLSEEGQRVKRQTGTLQETFQQLQNLQQQQSQQNSQRPQGSSQSGSSFGQQNTGGGSSFGSSNQGGGSQQRPSSGTNNQGSNQFNRPSSQSGNTFNRPNGNQQGFGNGNQQGGSRPSTTVQSPLNVVSSELTVPEAPCIRNCMAVSTYDPVCGSDDITYTNRAKFRCAQQCGRRVSEAYRGACVTTPSPN